MPNRIPRVKNRSMGRPERARHLVHLGLELLERRDTPSQAFGAGDIIATLVGTGSTLTSSGTATSIVEYNPSTANTVVQTIALPSTGTGAFTESGTATGEGYLTDASDGHSVELGGYNVAASTSVASAVGTVAVIQPAGTVDLTTHIPNASTAFGSSNSIKAVASTDGLGFYVATDNYIQYVPYGNSATTATTTVEKYFTANDGTSGGFETSQSPNDVTIGDDQLYGDAGSEAQTDGVPAADGPYTIGNGLPTTGGQSASVFQGPSTTEVNGAFVTSEQFSVSPDGQVFIIADARTNGAGGLYVWQISTGNTLAMIGSYNYATTGLTGLSVNWSNPSAPTIYAVTTDTNSGNSANSIVAFTNVSINENLGSASLGSPTTVATAAANEAFRGVALVPVAAGSSATTTTLNVSNSGGAYGAVGLSAQIAGGTGSYSGFVSFQSNGVEIGSAPVNGNTATLSPDTNLPGGTYAAGNLTAVYTGDANNAASTSTNNPAATVAKYSTGETVSDSGGGNAIVGTPDTLTDTLSVPAGTLPTGTVQFYDGGTGSGNAIGSPVSVVEEITPTGPGGTAQISFVASLPWSFTTAGTHQIYAAYSGDSNFAAVTNLTADFITVVNATTTTITSTNTNPGGNGVVVTFTVTVTGNTTVGAPTGSVQWAINGEDIGSPASLTPQSGTDYSTATLTETTSLTETAPGTVTPGVDSVTAVYSPTSGNTYGTSTGVLNQTVQAIPLAAGDVLVYQTGDGEGTYFNSSDSGLANTVYIDEYNPTTNALVEQIVMPTSTGGGYNAFTQQGYYGFGAFMNSTANGDFVFSGDDVSPGGNGETAPQDIAVLYPNGTINDSTIDTGAYTLRSVASVDGKEFWEGTSGGVYYTTLGADGASTQVNATSPTVTGRNIKISNGQLYISSDTANFVGVSTVGTGLPTTTGQTVTLLNHMQASDYSTSAFGPYDYFFATLKPGDTSPDTLYVTDDAGGLLKYTLSGGVWTLTATAPLDANDSSTPNEYCALTGVVNNGVVTLFATDNVQFGATTGGSVVEVTDNSGYGGTAFQNASPTYIANAGNNTNWHGVVVVPIETQVAITSSTASAAASGASITYSATVTAANGSTTLPGTVQFFDGLVPIGSAVSVPSSGIVTLTVTTALTQQSGLFITPGIDSISAVYSGDYDGDYNGASGYAQSSAAINQVVKPQTFGSGDVLVERVGDGTNSWNTSAGSAVYADEISASGALVQSIAMPTADAAGSDGNYYHALVEIGTQQAAGQLSLSGNAQDVFLVGYDDTPTLYTAPTTDNSDRTIARIGYDGTVTTETINNAAVTTGSFPSYVTSVYSPDGNQVYLAGDENFGIQYLSSWTPGAATVAATPIVSETGSAFANFISLQAENNVLYVIGQSASSGQPEYNLMKVSTSTSGQLPTTSGQTFSAVLGSPPFTPEDAYFASDNTLYVSGRGGSSGNSDDAGTITKYSLVSGSWVASSTTINAAPVGGSSPPTGGTPGFFYLSGYTNPTTSAVTLFETWATFKSTTSASISGIVESVQDTSGYNAAPSSTAVTALNTANSTNAIGLQYHGVALVPLIVTSVATDAGTAPIVSTSVATTSGTTYVTVTTDGNVTYTAGDPIVVAGNVDNNGGSTADGAFTVYQVVSATSFEYIDNAAAGTTSGMGGTVTDTAKGALGSLGSGAVGSSQRSMVDSITYVFSEPVNLAGSGAGFTLAVVSGQSGTLPAGVTYTTPDGGFTWVATFTGVTGGSIANGVYTTTLNNSAITADANSAIAPLATGNKTDTFYRLFGDINGDQTVNNADNVQLKKTYLLSSGTTGYNASLDYNADGTVNNSDNVQFKKDYLVSYSGFTSTI